MAIKAGIRPGPRIFVLLLLIVALVFLGLLWFDFLGIINAKDTISPVLSLLRFRTRTEIEDVQSPELLDDQRIQMQWEALTLREEELNRREEAISAKEAEIEQMVESLNEKEKALEEREKSFNERTSQYDNKSANLEQNSRYLVGMPPENAVAIMEKMEDQDIVDVLKVTERLAQAEGEDSVVAYWLSLMEPERAAVLQRKMAKKP